MKPTAVQLADMLSRTLAALETPGDLDAEEIEHVKEDASQMLEDFEHGQ